MIVALEYTACFDDYLPSMGAIETRNNLDPAKGWLRSFNLGARRTVAVGQKEGKMKDVADCMEDVLRQYYLANLEPMPANLFFSTVKALFTFKGVKFVEKPDGINKVMYLSDEVIGIV